MPFGYVARRFGQLLLVFWVAATLNFLIPRLTPGDPVATELGQKLVAQGSGGSGVNAAIKYYDAQFGFDKPLYTQYFNFWKSLFRGDLGVSVANYPQSVS